MMVERGGKGGYCRLKKPREEDGQRVSNEFWIWKPRPWACRSALTAQRYE